jgi:hypothetical protein
MLYHIELSVQVIIMDLFAVVPDRFFSVLASPSRAIYAHVLFLIYDLHKQELYGTPREAVIDAASAYLETEELDVDGELDPTLSPRDKSGAVLRRLQETGWLEVEQRSDYQQYVSLADYAIRVLDTLDRLRRQERQEYAGYVLATYVALTSPEAESNPGLAIGKAHDQTQQLVRDLKSLHDNIKRYTERLLKEKEPRAILAMHFGDYKLEVLDRSYHRLKTTDNVSKYRPRILERIDQWLGTPGWLATTAGDEVRRGRHATQEEAEEHLQGMLAYLRSSYEHMDDLLDEIDRRNAQYAKASLEHVRYLLSQGGDAEGRLVGLLRLLGGQLRNGALAPDTAWPADWEGLFQLQTVQTLEEGSLYTPRAARRNLKPRPLDLTEVTAAERARAKTRLRQRLAAKLTYGRINEYVLDRLGDRREIRAADLGIETEGDFVRLIYVAAYGSSARVRYRVDLQGAPAQSADHRFSFKNIRIRRK